MNSLKYVLLLFLFGFVLTSGQTNSIISKSGGTPAVNIPVTVSSSAGSTNLYFGLDPAATDGIDAAIGETELPPLPPTGIFDSRFVDDPNAEMPILGNGIQKDFRQGTSVFNGSKIHFFSTLAGTGTTYKVKWNLPAGVTGILIDAASGGLVINKPMSGKDSITVNKSMTTLKMTIDYVLDSPVQYIVTPSNLSPTVGSNITISAQLVDAAGSAKAVAGKVITWSSTGAGGSFSAATSTTNTSGVATVTFTVSQSAGVTHTVTGTDNTTPTALTGTSAEIKTVAGAANKYIVTSSRSSVSAGDTVKISAQLSDQYGNFISTIGKTVTWSKTGVGGSFASSTSSTDANGKAIVVFTTSSTIGTTHTITATDNNNLTGTSGNISVAAGPPTKYVVTSSRTNPVAGDTVKITAQLTDQFSNPVSLSGKTITWSKTGNGGSFSAATNTTDANGKATVILTTSSTVGTVYVVTATDNNSLTGQTGNITTVTGPPVKYIIATKTVNPTVGSNILISAQLVDVANNPIKTAGKILTWSKTGLGGSFSSPTSTTDAEGVANVTFTVSQTAGVIHKVTGTDNTTPTALTGTTGEITTMADIATKYIVSVSRTAPVIGDTVKIKAQLSDQYNNNVTTSGKTISWSATNGGSFSTSTSLTDANGLAAVIFTVSSVRNTNHVITATDNNSITGSSPVVTTKSNLPEITQSIIVANGTKSQVLEFGLDPSATDGIDSFFGEAELPPLPPTGNFDSRFVDDPNALNPLFGNGVLKDYRQGSEKYNGVKSHFIFCQLESGTTYKVKWNFPLGYVGVLNDVFTGNIINKIMIGKDSLTVSKSYNIIKITMTYLLGPLPTPVLKSPVNNAVDEPLPAKLVWYKSAFAEKYKVEISSNSTFGTILWQDSTIVDTTVNYVAVPLTKYFWRVTAKNSNAINQHSLPSEIWNFKTKLVPPEKPVLATPANNSTNQSINPTLTWNATLYTDTYRLQVAKDANFTQLVFNDSTLTSNSKQVGTLLGLTNYYWRVNAKNAAGKSAYSDAFVFTTELTIPPTPQLVSPVNNVVDQELTLQLKWNKSFLASTYKLIIASDAGFTNVILSDSTITDTVKQVTSLTPLMKYYWKVRAKNDAGISAYSTVWNFKTKLVPPEKPVLATPTNNATNQLINPTLTWNTALYTDTYRLQVAKDANFTQLVFDDSTLTGTTKQVGTLLGLTNYYWRVNAKNAAGKSAFSDPFVFTTELTIPPTPQLSSPANNEIDQDLSLQLKWNKSFLASTYKLIVASDAGFTNVIVSDSTITDTLKQITSLTPLVKYYWKVRAKNDAGTSAYSTAWNFTTKLVPPGKIILSSPTNNSIDQPLLMTMSWNSIEYADKYHLEVSTNNSFSTIVYQVDTVATSTKIPVLKIFTTYYWRVRGFNTAGNGEFSDTWSFKTLNVTWSADIGIQDKNNTGSINLVFGTAPVATNDFDALYGETPWPPTPPTGSFDAAFLFPNGSDKSIRDFRKDAQDSIAWQIDFQPGLSGYPMTFTWDNTKLPEGSFALVDLSGGLVINVNMKAVNSYTLTNAAIKSMLIKYNKSISVPLNLAVGWNLVGMPVKMASMNYKDLFPEATSPVYYYDATYKVATTLENSKGYWVKYGAVSNKVFTGEKVSITSIPVKLGWNMIAVSDAVIQTTSITSNPAGIVTSPYYEYKSSYKESKALEAGKGYWIKVNANGSLNLPASSPAISKMNIVSEEEIVDKADGTQVMIVDGNGKSGSLELRKGLSNMEKYDLPPIPPKGEFDIRWQSDRKVEKSGEGFREIVISSAQYPIQIHVEGRDLRIKDIAGGMIINRLIKKGEYLTISNKNVDRLQIEEIQIPTQYELSQNYPNPFNPETTIRYQLPEGGKVALRIFDVLGREVETLVNSNQDAGQYELRWNASKLSSGVYFYALTSGSFKSVKKLLLIK